jgi:hypothetical protein
LSPHEPENYELGGPQEPAHKYKESKGDGYTTIIRNRIYSLFAFHVVKYNITPFWWELQEATTQWFDK